MKNFVLSFLGSCGRREKTRRRVWSRRRGISIIWVAYGLTMFLGICAMVVDEGLWYAHRANMSKAADFAALAGASKMALATSADATTLSTAATTAQDSAEDNGFKNGTNGVVVTTAVDTTNYTFTVNISQPYRTFFGAIFKVYSKNIGAKAVAEYTYTTYGKLSITGLNYGLNDGPINLGLYGPNQVSERGDRYGVKYKLSGSSVIANPDYRANGYDFAVSVPTSGAISTNAILQIYDPDSYDSGADTTAGGKEWDEDGKDYYSSAGKQGTNQATTTKYTLYSDNGTPYDTSDDTQIGSPISVGSDSTKDKKWNNMFTFNPSSYRSTNPNVNFRMNAVTTTGGNENGFNIRVIKTGDTDATFSSGGNGTDVSAIQTIPVNFGLTGTGTIVLGYVPQGATKITVNHFDSDVGVTAGTTIGYKYVTTSGTTSSTYNGSALLGSASNDQVETDTITLPSNYPGGTWKATYSAGLSDNTTWDLNYVGPPMGQAGTIRLIE